jgi:hypothetical protein
MASRIRLPTSSAVIVIAATAALPSGTCARNSRSQGVGSCAGDAPVNALSKTTTATRNMDDLALDDFCSSRQLRFVPSTTVSLPTADQNRRSFE